MQGKKKKGPLSCQEQKQPLHSITLTGCWGALTLHWGEEQNPKWGPREQKCDTCHHLSPISNISHPLPPPPPTKSPFLSRGSPSPTGSTARGTSLAPPGPVQDWCHHECTTGQAVPQPDPELMTQGLRALCIEDQNHTEPPATQGPSASRIASLSG